MFGFEIPAAEYNLSTDFFIISCLSSIDNGNKIGMAAANVLIFDNRERIDSNGLLITPDGLAKCKNLKEKKICIQTTEEVFCPAGAAALYTRELLRDIEFEGEYLDEDFKLYSEDLDLGWRARLRGWKCIYNPKAMVYHHQSATAGRYSEIVGYYVTRNTLFNIIKNYSGVLCCKGIALFFLKYQLFLTGMALRAKKGPAQNFRKNMTVLKMAGTALRGIRDVVPLLPRMMKKRKYIQSRRLISRKEIQKWFFHFGYSFLESLYK